MSQPEPEQIVVEPPNETGGDPSTSPVEAVPFSAQQFPMERPSVPHQGRRRLRSPGLKWYKHYDGPDCFLNGRVLVIDYIKQGTQASMTLSESTRVSSQRVRAKPAGNAKGSRAGVRFHPWAQASILCRSFSRDSTHNVWRNYADP